MSITNPVIKKVFQDLEAYKDFCRFEGHVFDEKALYNRRDKNWQAYDAYLSGHKKKNTFKPRKAHKN
jgi:hypothetical protein